MISKKANKVIILKHIYSFKMKELFVNFFDDDDDFFKVVIILTKILGKDLPKGWGGFCKTFR